MERGDTSHFVAAAEATDLTTAAAACGRIDEDSLRGECASHVVRELGSEDIEAAAEACEVASGAWRDECLFVLAEIDPSPAADSARWCRQAGRYTISCLMHLWQGEAASLKREHPMEEAVQRYAEALAWAGEDLDDTLTRRAWGLFYRTELDPARPLDTSSCAALPEPHPRYCRAGTQEALGRGLNVWVRANGPAALMQACGLPDDVSRAEAIGRITGLTYEPAGGLDAIASEQLASHCERGP
ncbi:MAG TPA: hypothetical protein QGF58_05525 [Myxococcota bacterium]|nr:hypothetical protein [Myxococcota bacterium]